MKFQKYVLQISWLLQKFDKLKDSNSMILINSTHYKTMFHMQINSQEMNSKTLNSIHHKKYFKIFFTGEINPKKERKSKRELKISKITKRI